MCSEGLSRTHAWIPWLPICWFKWPSLSKNKKPALSRLYLSDPEVSPGSAFSSPAWNCSLTQTKHVPSVSLLSPGSKIPLANPSWTTTSPDSFLLNCHMDPPSKLQASPTVGLVAQTPNQDPETWVFGSEPQSKKIPLHRREPSRCFVHLANRWNEATAVQMGPRGSPSQPLPYFTPITRSITRLKSMEKTEHWKRFSCGYKGH